MSQQAPGTWHADPSHFRTPGRREFLYVGLAGGLGLTLGDLLRLEARGAAPQTTPAAARTGRPRAQSLIHIFLKGGFAHMDSFDPKPDSPVEYRGELGTIATRLNGVRFSEHLPQTAEVADKLTLLRSITHTEVDHGRGEHTMFTGYQPSPALVYPSMGSVVSMQLGPRNELPAYVCVPTPTSTYAGSGFLSTAHGPFALGSDPARAGFTVRDLALPAGVDEARADRRRNLLATVNEHFAGIEQSDHLDAMDAFTQRAYAMLGSARAREAFRLQAESAQTRDAYGRRSAGSRMLLARRLIEAGVRLVSLLYGRWDTHSAHFRGISLQMPEFDRAFAALIRDLDQRGLLDSTLVMVTTEFGRTPRVNTGGGRDHWPRVFSVVVAGGGIRRGHVHGSSDALAAEPDRNPLQVRDFLATLYAQLGVDVHREQQALGNRPIQILQNGNVVRELLA
jgi:uncharacterized protein (DUF1501 family)